MDPQSSPGRLTRHPLLYDLQLQMREQHLRVERPWGKQKESEEKESEGKAFIQLWNKQKSQQSAVASPWVKQRLHDWILKKPHQATPTHSNPATCFRVLEPIPDLGLQQGELGSSVAQRHSSKQLRRTASEPIQNLKPKRSMSNRKNPHRCKPSAPPTGKQSYNTCDSCSSSNNTPLSLHSSPTNLSDSGSQFCNYNTRLSHKNQRDICWGSLLNPPVLPTSPSQRPVHLVVRGHELLCRTQSLNTCHDYQQNSREQPQRASHTHENQEKEIEVEVKARFKGEARMMRIGATALAGNCNQRSSYRHSRRQKVTHTRSLPLSKQHSVTHHASVTMKTQCTGLVYNPQTLNRQYSCMESTPPPVQAGEIQSVWTFLHECGLRNQCEWIPGRQATLEEIQVVQPESQIHPYGTNPLSRLQLTAVRLAAGSVTELALRVAQGELRNGFAIVRPHGHDASQTSNIKPLSVAIATKQLQYRLNVRKILIVDWDVHHDNAIQEVFYTDPSVLYISLHRHGYGSPNSESGAPTEVGSGRGEGYNVNVAWSGQLHCPLGDAEYLAAFRAVVMPVAREFCPDVVLLSSEFSALEGHPATVPGHQVSAKCFGVLTRQLMEVARGRVVLALEGGHDLRVIWDAVEACISALLDNEMAPLSEDAVMGSGQGAHNCSLLPCVSASQSLQKVLQIQSKYWCSLKYGAHTPAQSYCSTASEATMALASLSMAAPKSISHQAADGLFWCCHDQNQPTEHEESEPVT